MKNYALYSDDELLFLLKENNEHAFTELYKRYWKKLFFQAGKKLQNLPIAEELVQEIFLDIWKRRTTLEIHSPLEHYLAAAVKFKIFNHLAKEHRETYMRAHLPMGTDASTEEQLRAKELQEQIATIVAALPEKCRLIYTLKEQGFTHKEISRSLNISTSTIETQVSRAMHKLRTGLGHFFSFFL